MSTKEKSAGRDIALRATGALLLLGCRLFFRWLFRNAGPAHHHDPDLLEYVVAGAGFICFSLGCVLLALGEHVFDEVELPASSTIWENPRMSTKAMNSSEDLCL